MQIVDRAKDLIKSGGEWISSVALEDAALRLPGVIDAAAIALPHPKWDQRPLLIVVIREGAGLTSADILEHLRGHVAKWWLPDEVHFARSVPRTATGKIDKLALRREFADRHTGQVRGAGE
jgi:fatty-acyl-CoA synthase